MFDWVPVNYYSSYFYLAMLLCLLIVLWQCHTGMVLKKDIATMNSVWGIMITVFLILYIGLRPISGYFGDTINYAKMFGDYIASNQPFQLEWDKEWLYHNLHNWCAHYADIQTLFLICGAIYVGSLWLACVRIFKNYYYLPLLVFFLMFTFWDYGVNGIRNGVGSSLFILALTYINNPPLAFFIAFLGSGFHNSVYLMIVAASIAFFIKNSYYYLAGWITCVGLSYAIGGRIQSFLGALSFMGEDDRFSSYLTRGTVESENIISTGAFRWDFIAFSTIGVAVGYYFIFRRNYKDVFYHWLYNTYLATNAFWVLIIRAQFSNRFAQISWFILPIVFIYPFMRKRFWKNHEKVLAYALVIFYAYGFYTNIIKTNVFGRLFF